MPQPENGRADLECPVIGGHDDGAAGAAYRAALNPGVAGECDGRHAVDHALCGEDAAAAAAAVAAAWPGDRQPPARTGGVGCPEWSRQAPCFRRNWPSQAAVKTTATLCPPNPNELLMTAIGSGPRACRSVGLTAISTPRSSSRSSTLIVGG